ncbi:MAG: protein kinase [Gemmatimonadetes bacterium]|nr:protein kinase [Gemmatimonadota bacterium]
MKRMDDPLLQSLARALGDRYEIERELGGGGMSRVFVATEKRLGRRVAIKVLSPDLMASLSVERFQQEILLAARLPHPHIVPVISAGEADSLPFFIMPFIEGESLRARITRGPLSVGEAARIMKEVAHALQFAHGRGVVHRDVKPDNVLLAQGSAVVTDFGVAKAIELSRSRARDSRPGITDGGLAMGTPQYMAPEQVAADPAMDHRVDLYALGLVAYEMLVGTPPFHGRGARAVLAAQLAERAPPLSQRRYGVPPAFEALVMRCLAKDPADRPQSAVEIVRVLESPEVAGSAAAVTQRTRRNADRNLWMVAGTCGMLFVLGAAYMSREPATDAIVSSADSSAESRQFAEALQAHLRTVDGDVGGVRAVLYREGDRLRVEVGPASARRTVDGSLRAPLSLMDSVAAVVRRTR